MALSRIARETADEIQNHDWSDAPWRLDRAGHQRSDDRRKLTVDVLDEVETGRVRTNVMWVAAQVLMHSDPNLDIHEFAEACGVPRRIIYNSDGRKSAALRMGLRLDMEGRVAKPGKWNDDEEKSA